MKRCPNCARETMRTADWVCQWCGYPLMSGSFKKIDKTYRELKEERMSQVQTIEKEEAELVLAPDDEPEVELETELEPEPQTELETEVAPVEESGSAPEPELEVELAAEESEQARETEPEPEPVKPKPRTRRKATTAKKSTTKTDTESAEKPAGKTATRKKKAEKAEVTSEKESEPESSPAGTESEPESPPVEMETEPETKPVSAADVIEVTVADLVSAYETDGEAADARFNGQILRVSGTIGRVESNDARGIYYINLTDSTEDPLAQGVRCVFDASHSMELSRLEPGQQVTVQGNYSGSMIDISLRDCSIIS